MNPPPWEVHVIDGITGPVQKTLELERSVPECGRQPSVIVAGKCGEKVIAGGGRGAGRRRLGAMEADLFWMSEEVVASTKLCPFRARQVARLSRILRPHCITLQGMG